MSVVVQMEMPENCGVCPFVTEYSRCVFLGMYAIDEERRADNCPIICQLPEGHGRLVDAKKIDFVMFTNEDSTFRCGWNNGVRSVMQHAETIVPAERKDNGETC